MDKDVKYFASIHPGSTRINEDAMSTTSSTYWTRTYNTPSLDNEMGGLDWPLPWAQELFKIFAWGVASTNSPRATHYNKEFLWLFFFCHRSLTSVFLKTREYLNIWSQNINKLQYKKKKSAYLRSRAWVTAIPSLILISFLLLLTDLHYFFSLQHSRNSQLHKTMLVGKTVAASVSLVLSPFSILILYCVNDSHAADIFNTERE